MLSIFNVSSLEFIDNISDKDLLRFSPTRNLRKNYADQELIRRIFTEDITVNPEPEPPPVYPEIIQKLIDANCQTADDINKIIKSYPYELNSAIFDYKYLNWTKLGEGYISRNNEAYSFMNAGAQQSNIFPSSNADIKISLTVTPMNTETKIILLLYTNLNTSSTTTPSYYLSYEGATEQFTIKRMSTNNGTTVTGSNYTETFSFSEPTELTFHKYSNGRVGLSINDDSPFTSIETTSTFNPRHIRINTNKSASTIKTSWLKIDKFQISVNNSIVSQWNE